MPELKTRSGEHAIVQQYREQYKKVCQLDPRYSLDVSEDVFVKEFPKFKREYKGAVKDHKGRTQVVQQVWRAFQLEVARGYTGRGISPVSKNPRSKGPVGRGTANNATEQKAGTNSTGNTPKDGEGKAEGN